MTLFKQITRTALPRHHLPHKVEAHVLEVSNLSVHYDGNVALEGINFKLEAGERIAVVGPNGAGKSTLFKVIAGVLAPSHGEVKIYGDTPGGHICIAYIPQRSQVDWNFPVNVADVVMMGRIGKLGLFRWPKASDWEYVHECLEIVGLAHLARQQIGELSGGQQQRMFIARALAQDAAIMLMDEPFTGLDMTSQEGILNLLDVLHHRGVTILISTHDLNLASGHFEQVMLLNRRLMGFGSPAEVFTTERLLQAFGGHLRLMEGKDHLIAVSDTCCEGDSPA